MVGSKRQIIYFHFAPILRFFSFSEPHLKKTFYILSTFEKTKLLMPNCSSWNGLFFRLSRDKIRPAGHNRPANLFGKAFYNLNMAHGSQIKAYNCL